MKVTFCGHKEVADRDAVEQWLRSVCSDLIAHGADEFYLGGYGGFDHLCAAVLRDLKKSHPQIRLILVLPYLNSSMITDGYDETLYPPLESVPRRFAISRRNEWMVLESDAVVAYVTHGWGGAAKTLEYARRKKKNIRFSAHQSRFGNEANSHYGGAGRMRRSGNQCRHPVRLRISGPAAMRLFDADRRRADLFHR